MLKRFYRIRDELVNASKHEDANFSIDSSVRFAGQVRRFCAMLSEIDVVTKSLQTRGRTLGECRDDIEILMQAVNTDKSLPGTALYQCKMGFDHVGECSFFESAVTKIQQGKESEMSPAEKLAVRAESSLQD